MARKNPSVKFTLLGICSLAVLGLIAWEYQRLHTQNQVRLFFRNGDRILSFVNPRPLEPTGPPNSHLHPLKTKFGNLLFLIPQLEIHIPPKYLSDPFDPHHDMELRHGIVTHPIPIESPLGQPNQPAWFCFSAGPAEVGPILETNLIHQSEGRKYRFISMPYDVSNGLWSEGYLFMDSHGNQRGRLPRQYY
ncbi:hypothetical protein GF373_14905 [bacterium]|nr:hypothetical protein [bacterium]